MSKTKILKVKGDWQEVVDDCRATVVNHHWARNLLRNSKEIS